MQQGSAFYAYVLAFYLIWIVWRQHHTLFDQIRSVSTAMIGLHFPLLLLAAFLPYTTTVLGHYPGNSVAALLFGLVFGLLLASRAAIQTLAGRDDEVLQPEADRHQYRHGLGRHRLLGPDLAVRVVGAVDADPVVPDRAGR